MTETASVTFHRIYALSRDASRKGRDDPVDHDLEDKNDDDDDDDDNHFGDENGDDDADDDVDDL